MKKLLVSLLCVMMVMCMMPTMAFAAETAGIAGADGTADAVEVDSYDELLAALEQENANIKMTGDITADAAQSSGYGKAGIVLNAGDVLDGGGNKLTINGANGTWDCAVAMKGGEVKNLTIAGAFRGVFMPGANGDVVIDNCEFTDVVYTFNSDAGSKDYSVTVKDTVLNGWTSYSDVHKSVTFDGCTFGEGSGYAFFRPYQPTAFVNCDFEEGFELDTGKTDENTLTFDGCKYNDAPLSSENNDMFYNGGSVIIDGEETDVNQYVAKIGEDKFMTFSKALEAAAAGDEVTIELLDDVEWKTGAEHGSTPLIPEDAAAAKVTIDGKGLYTFTATGDGVGSIRAANGGTLVFQDVSFVDKSESYAEGSREFTYLEFAGNLEFEGCTFSSGIQLDADNNPEPVLNAKFTDCSFHSPNNSEYSVWMGHGTAEFADCTFTGTRALKMHEAYGSAVDSVTVTGCTFDGISQKPGIAIGTLDAYTTVVVSDCKFINCGKADRDCPDYKDGVFESDTVLATIDETGLSDAAAVGGELWRAYLNPENSRITLDSGNITYTSSIEYKLYSGTELLSTTTLKEGTDIAKGFVGELTSSVYTNMPKDSTGTYWDRTGWIAKDSVVPTHADLVVDGIVVDTAKIIKIVGPETYADITAQDWIDFPNTYADYAIGGGILVDSGDEAGICFEVLNVQNNDTVKVELYSGSTKLVTKEFTFAEGGDAKTCTFYTVGTSSSWTQTPSPWKAYDRIVPTHAVLYINGMEFGQDSVEFTDAEWVAFPGTAAPYVPSTPSKPAVPSVPAEPEDTDAELMAKVDGMQLVARSEMSSAKGKKAVKVRWYEEDGEDISFLEGFEIFRSIKRFEGYGSKPFFETERETYWNTDIEAGMKYFYKVRGYVTVDGEKYYTDWSLKAWRTVE